MSENRPTRHLACAAAVVILGHLPGNAFAEQDELSTIPADRPLRAGFVIVDGVYNTELMAPWDVFDHTRFHAGAHPGIEVFTVASGREPVTTAEGIRIVPDFTFEDAPPLDILVVPSAEHSRDRDRADDRLVQWVRHTGQRARFVVSLCWGAFILAEAGLLDGHPVTTFPEDLRTFAEAFPDLDLRVNVSFVHDGQLLTSQGGVRSYDVAMYLVDLLFGPQVARGVGDGLLIEWPWPENIRPDFVSDPRYSLQRPDGPTDGAGAQ